jgi:hypothetical protein
MSLWWWFLIMPEVAKFYGTETRYKQIWDGMRNIKKNADAMRAAVEQGIDPATVDVELAGREGNDRSIMSPWLLFPSLIPFPQYTKTPSSRCSLNFC